ncbi:double-strand break repair helicase AddA [Sphingomonas sabuli]|uniref:DNA 3'-5' helicase n=1 Tax=Sphingomonas sabuli TaxID=2764186 RepID=A0A7G9L3C3_9SPHN|nr:double-strand break repair helicase AddA [Sphingomonas sabuli]QNM83122.1 double-strand break repair helicase AddA [Sphingomonas sabuli]
MNGRREPVKPLQDTQLLASDPQAHAAVSASAGTGKTQVLTARVLRLLIQGASPQSLLCLTFTKAAASEMANRIGAQLASWVRLKDSDLGADLLNLGESNDPPTRRRARQLFAQVLDCPGGLRIQTIHAFAQSLLAAFPAEAGITPGFQPIEGRAEQELVRRTLADLVTDAEQRGDTRLFADIQCLSRRLGEAGAVDYLKACTSRHDALAALGDPDGLESRLRAVMQLPDGSVEDYLADRCSDTGFDCDLLRAIADANRTWGTATGTGMVDKVERWLAMPWADRAAALPDLASIVFTGKGDLRKVSAGQLKADAAYQDQAERLAEAVAELLHVQTGARLAAEMAAGLRAGQAFARAYTRAKRAAGVADFNDLIDWTRHLLGRPGMGEWVRFKLDRQIDHILVDEAQDTNAAQWDIIDRLVEEFFTGASEEDRRWRTLFTVGDFKQAIYGFQGTDPEQFEEARRKYKALANALVEAERTSDTDEARAREFRDLSIDASFRSAQPILDVVDAVIGTLGAEAMGLRGKPPRHVAFHADRPGQVELWPPFAVDDGEQGGDEGEERWVDIRDRLYADALAQRIADLVDEAPVLGSTRRKLTPGDILILVRSRGELAALIVARLFARRVPVAGVDRLHLQEPLAVQDLLAAVRFAVQPGDDLSLACLLVSPLIGWDQDQLRDLAQGRRTTLWRALRDRAGESPAFAAAYAALGDLLRMADFTPPSRFLETILSGPLQGRRKLYARLGMASRDPIDELMNSAIEFERHETGSLDRFLAWFSRGDVDVQRDAGGPANEVRVMTVHGSKGLQAPVVIVADATADPAKLGRTPLTLDFPVQGRVAPLLRPKKDERLSPFAEILDEQDVRDLQEHWRLLYVALTRAADRLIVAGVKPKEKKDGSDPRPENSWHRAVQAGLLAAGARPAEDGDDLNLVHGSNAPVAVRAGKPVDVPPAGIPAWATSAAPPEARPPRPLAPSAMAEDREAAPPPSPEMKAAAERGTIIHALLERLPAVAPDQREAAALRWLDRSAGVADPAARQDIADIVCGIIADTQFAPLFGPGSLGEAPIAATLPDGRVIAGTVDRLLVQPDRVLVVDYKTGRAPDGAAAIPLSHRVQMDAYRQALGVIFPGRAIEAALLYTAAARFYPVDG